MFPAPATELFQFQFLFGRLFWFAGKIIHPFALGTLYFAEWFFYRHSFKFKFYEPGEGVEPTTSSLPMTRSNRLSYPGIIYFRFAIAWSIHFFNFVLLQLIINTPVILLFLYVPLPLGCKIVTEPICPALISSPFAQKSIASLWFASLNKSKLYLIFSFLTPHILSKNSRNIFISLGSELASLTALLLLLLPSPQKIPNPRPYNFCSSLVKISLMWKGSPVGFARIYAASSGRSYIIFLVYFWKATFFACGQGGIRTPVGRSRVVYSHVQLAALAPAQLFNFTKILSFIQSFCRIFSSIHQYFCGDRKEALSALSILLFCCLVLRKTPPALCTADTQ